jgi:Leucine-rich repeat (LRR) protein
VIWGIQLTGALPRELGLLSKLTYLHLFENQLTGTIPTELGMLSNLKYFTLHDNQLTITLLAELGLIALTQLYLLDKQSIYWYDPILLLRYQQFKCL